MSTDFYPGRPITEKSIRRNLPTSLEFHAENEEAGSRAYSLDSKTGRIVCDFCDLVALMSTMLKIVSTEYKRDVQIQEVFGVSTVVIGHTTNFIVVETSNRQLWKLVVPEGFIQSIFKNAMENISHDTARVHIEV